jgi:hypothetical protein
MVLVGLEQNLVIINLLSIFKFKMIALGLDQTYIIISYFALIFGLLNVSLIMGLLYSYWKTYKEVKSGFTIGLLYFTSLILLQNIFIIIFLGIQLILPLPVVPSTQFHEPRLPLLLINLIQFIALVILFRITRK